MKVLWGVLSDRADDGQVAPVPSTAKGFDPGLEVLDEVPCRKPADVDEGAAPPHQPRPTGKHGIDGVSREHLAAIEHRLTIVERVTVADLRLLDGLHVREPLIELQLAERGPKKADRTDLVVGIARLHELDVRELAVDERHGRIQVAGLRRAVTTGRV